MGLHDKTPESQALDRLASLFKIAFSTDTIGPMGVIEFNGMRQADAINRLADSVDNVATALNDIAAAILYDEE
jgi:hypothetical protein